jgi:hypothetical protein
MCAISRHEVDNRCFVLEMTSKINPAFIRLKQRILVSCCVEICARSIQRRHAGVATARKIDGCEVERQAE